VDGQQVGPVGGKGHPEYLRLVDELKTLHLLKSGGYGNGADPLNNFTVVGQATGQPRYLYPVLRSLEKLTRILSLHAQGRVGELEEEFKDVASLNLCAAAMLREDYAPTLASVPPDNVRPLEMRGTRGSDGGADPEGSVA
jgi:hypothetical protein